jgi:hypothetical protein
LIRSRDALTQKGFGVFGKAKRSNEKHQKRINVAKLRVSKFGEQRLSPKVSFRSWGALARLREPACSTAPARQPLVKVQRSLGVKRVDWYPRLTRVPGSRAVLVLD